jgi:hypothetical protein
LNCYVFDKLTGKGCDVVCIRIARDTAIVYLAEIKSCNFSIKDANKVVEQISFAENYIKDNKNDFELENVRKLKFVKIFIHESKRSCSIDSRAKNYILRKADIKFIELKNLENYSESIVKLIRQIYNFYKKNKD